MTTLLSPKLTTSQSMLTPAILVERENQLMVDAGRGIYILGLIAILLSDFSLGAGSWLAGGGVLLALVAAWMVVTHAWRLQAELPNQYDDAYHAPFSLGNSFRHYVLEMLCITLAFAALQIFIWAILRITG